MSTITTSVEMEIENYEEFKDTLDKIKYHLEQIKLLNDSMPHITTKIVTSTK